MSLANTQTQSQRRTTVHSSETTQQKTRHSSQRNECYSHKPSAHSVEFVDRRRQRDGNRRHRNKTPKQRVSPHQGRIKTMHKHAFWRRIPHRIRQKPVQNGPLFPRGAVRGVHSAARAANATNDAGNRRVRVCLGVKRGRVTLGTGNKLLTLLCPNVSFFVVFGALCFSHVFGGFFGGKFMFSMCLCGM